MLEEVEGPAGLEVVVQGGDALPRLRDAAKRQDAHDAVARAGRYASELLDAGFLLRPARHDLELAGAEPGSTSVFGQPGVHAGVGLDEEQSGDARWVEISEAQKSVSVQNCPPCVTGGLTSGSAQSHSLFDLTLSFTPKGCEHLGLLAYRDL